MLKEILFVNFSLILPICKIIKFCKFLLFSYHIHSSSSIIFMTTCELLLLPIHIG